MVILFGFCYQKSNKEKGAKSHQKSGNFVVFFFEFKSRLDSLLKVVILAGGFGTRLGEETDRIPKPLIQIGSMPIIWHIMKFYSSYGFSDFIICCGYKGYLIKEFFNNYALHASNVTFDFSKDQMVVHDRKVEPWQVTLVDTGLTTMTGGRLQAVKEFLDDDAPFCMTYGDGLSDINLTNLVDFHHSSGALAPLSAVRPPARFGALEITGDKVVNFSEKPFGGEGRINGGFFVLSPKTLSLIDDDRTIWERGPLETLAQQNELNAFVHDGFWQPMDTLRDKNELNDIWDSGQAPWKRW